MRNFGTFEIFVAKSEKNPISSLKFWKISNLKSDFLLILQKISNVPKFRKFICPEIQVCEVSEKKNSRKNDLWSNRNLKKNSQFFNLKLDFFLIFQNKHQKTRKFQKFIYCEPHLSKFWAKSEKLFSGRAGAHYHGCRRGC